MAAIKVLSLRDCLEVLRWWTRRSVKVDLKEGGDVPDEVLDTLATFGFSDHEVWFNGSVPTLGCEGFARLRRARPGGLLQAPIDSSSRSSSRRPSSPRTSSPRCGAGG